ncbi:P-loop containing nucleoside triphosphate hydrolase protein, partial [Dendrothele bispora CBS 962.96]
SIKKIRDLVERKTGKRACWWQIKTALAIYSGKDVVGVARTGAGKTMSFWIALMMVHEEGRNQVAVVVTPLNLLGKQNAFQLNDGSDIAEGKYNIILISPELLNDQLCQTLMKNPKFAAMVMYFVFDEAHRISQWGTTFRNQYLHVGIIRYLLSNTPHTIPFHIASATLPRAILDDVVEIL